jgi:hypothetical protein
MMSKKDGNFDSGFPTISVRASLKKIVMADKANLIFEDLSFSPDQYAQLERWRSGGDVIRITLEQIQGTL